jgi:hypothetical protein
MPDLLSALLPRLESRRLEGLDAGPHALYPAYADCSLVNLPSSICHWLGVPGFGRPPLAPEILNTYNRQFQHVILCVVDGLGLNTLQDAIHLGRRVRDLAIWPELSAQAALAPLTSIAPSTTAAALTTFWTGRTPAEHGVFAYEVWLKEYGVIANMILHSPASYAGDPGSLRRAGFDPETFLPVPTLGSHLLDHGVRVFTHQHHTIARSGLSTMLFPGAQIVPFRSLSDLWVTLAQTLDACAGEKTYSYIYWGDLDEHSHRFGPDDERVALEFAAFSRQLAYFLQSKRARHTASSDTLLILTADHGHLSTPRSPAYELRHHPDLLDCLVMSPSGEARLPVVYLRPGREERFLRCLEQAWPGEFLAVPSDQVLRSGLFGDGALHPRFADRIGDYIIFPQGSAYWWFAEKENHLLGRHGGLSRTEMLVPFFAFTL